jgi:hypothetical protein
MIIQPSLYFCISIFLGESGVRTPIQMKYTCSLCFGDNPWKKAFKSTFFVSTSNVSGQLIVVNQCPSRKSFHFIFLIEKPHLW